MLISEEGCSIEIAVHIVQRAKKDNIVVIVEDG